MRIAHVMRRLSFEEWGGTEQTVWNLAKAQAKAGHETRIFATTALCDVREETVDGIPVRRFRPVYPWWPMRKALAAELDLKGGNPFVPGLGAWLVRWKPDVVHCHAMARIAELCMRTARKAGAKCVVSLHGGGANVPAAEAASLKSPTRGLLPWGKMIDYAMGWTRRVPEDADGIVCVGEDEYMRYKDRHPHVLHLPNGVDAALFAKAAKMRAEGGAGQARGGRRPVLLCVARIDRQKNQMALVEWLGRHPEGEVRLAGPVTQPDYMAALAARAEELGAADRLVATGALKPGGEELLREFARADVFVLPSRHEPFGIAVLEAWAAGLPVAASGVGGLGRLCARHPGAAEVFDPEDPAAMDAAVAKIAGDAELRRSMGECGMKAAAQYAWDALAARLCDFCRSL